ncbi:ferric reductase transmembrane protein-like protein [Leptomonas pyrrhocoris]|uniref:Ferric reductase transmembrane protein-like protein n=1 Tax=Leptomonas pyrrhocoris TaxID=157538 RepID=A0A0N0VGK8_LEPPY|nr:ferric reductase transmembrane protein-like protein [Leptomonas pyrrhocoris]KPA83244.1 ferric reductase transmembrane protein-like protein [Leptomonas pyrrhocoris]|eukprot:XP_015661683.1 ferric reductase transmembrane protein-like protein [Leptomonas pyrrhocoris]
MSTVDINDVPLTRKEVVARCRSLAATALVSLATVRLFCKNGGFANALQFHPIGMMIAFVMVLPDVATSFKRLQVKAKASTPVTKDVAERQPLDAGLPRGEVILRHQLAAFAMELAAAGGFAAIEYVKITNGYPHLMSPHGVVGAMCGFAILCQMVLGTLLRYVLTRGQPFYKTVVAAHKLTCLTIVVTSLMALVGGLLSTSYAELMVPSSTVRATIALASICIAVAGLVV